MYRLAFALCSLIAIVGLGEPGHAANLCGCTFPIYTPAQDHVYDTEFFGGLQLNFGDRTPQLVLGVRRTRTDQDDDVFGGKAEFDFKLNESFFSSTTFRVLGLVGDRDVQGEFGGGVSGLDLKPLLAGGVQGPYVEGGANYIFGAGLQGYLGANTLGRPSAPRSAKFTCPAGYYLGYFGPFTNDHECYVSHH